MNTLLKMYSLFVLCWDIVCVTIGCTLAIIESLYQVIKPPQQKSVKGEIVLVVGASRGVGRELALQMAALGAEVVCWDINGDGNRATVRDVRNAYGVPAHAYTVDVADREAVLATSKAVRRDVGDVTMLYHCCGVPSPRVLLTEPTPGVRQTMDVSVMSHFWIMEAFLPRMMDLNHGHLIALTSVAGLAGIRDKVPLCASQFAVQGIIESLSEELRVNKGNRVRLTLAHIYPFMNDGEAKDLRLRIPSYFGTIDPKEAAKQIISGVRRNYMEISIPRYLLHLGNIVKILPRKASVMFRELLDTGVDFC